MDLMDQYNNIKMKFPDHIILFQVGDFYEMFDEQAKEVSGLIGITLTSKGTHDMSGIPVNNLDFYIKKLIKEHNKKVAVCNQVETPEEAKKNNRSLVKREVTKIITPGTYFDDLNIDYNFILCITKHDDFFVLCYCDTGTGDCFIETTDKYQMDETIHRISPTEIILSEEIKELIKYDDMINICSIITNEIHEDIAEYMNKTFNLLISYLKNCYINIKPNLKKINNSIFIKTNNNTIRNLEIVEDLFGGKSNSLWNFLNKTKTPMGRRLGKILISRPLNNQNMINERLDCIKYFIDKYHRIGLNKFNICDINKLCNNMNNIKNIYELCLSLKNAIDFVNSFNDIPNLLYRMKKEYPKSHEEILSIISKEDTFIIKDPTLEKLKNEKTHLLTALEQCIDRYGVNCKLKYINDGYTIEVSNKIINVPSYFIFQRSLLNCNRYTTNDVIKLEQQIKEIDEKILEYENQQIKKFIEQIIKEKNKIEELSNLIAHMDFFQSCAINAIENKYTRPIFVDKKQYLNIESGRHPVLEKRKKIYIYNNTYLDDKNYIYLITGPNMGGKSTYLRQNALIVWMAQVGMFVPVKSIELSVFDGIFVRIGTADNIADNESTFMLEMKECSQILNNCTDKSLIIMDEIGRGTSAIEGKTILICIIEYLHKIGSISLFATHYYDIKLDFVINKKVKTKILNDNLVFLYEIENGISDNSFAVYIAENAGIPIEIVNRAKYIIKNNEI